MCDEVEFLKRLEVLVDEYIEQVPTDDGIEWYDSFRGFAECVLKEGDMIPAFLQWVRSRVG